MIERRQEPRAKSVFKSAYVRTEAGIQFVTLRNISESGVCIDAFPGVAEGQEIDFCFDSNAMHRGVVRWVGDGLCGLSTDGNGQAEVIHLMFPPRSVRLPLSVGVQLYVDGQREQAILHNISIRGACISSRRTPAPGQLVSLGICGVHFELATVRWVRDSLFGMRFTHPVHPVVFRDLVTKIQQTSEAVLDAEETLRYAYG
ncbi:PilZ domain-containing protein [Porphyrobacter sp. YT40]|uniref:PilZ domain-containing protein n=1 Tax=Porphyrobacter sp. YT40 TaxID=2547601 RepID=UPI001141621E|nr:PilZ domain-containing protein [Porphyrobacter sp. YT40]QDH33917.1 PilZ domain-containing protein [Porphyrobacter sp. YT40]